MDQHQRIARERIDRLFTEAAAAFSAHPERSHRYVQLARKIALRFRLRLPSSIKRRYCGYCLRYLHSGVNARVRTRNKKLIVYCFHCKHYRRLQLPQKTRTTRTVT